MLKVCDQPGCLNRTHNGTCVPCKNSRKLKTLRDTHNDRLAREMRPTPAERLFLQELPPCR